MGSSKTKGNGIGRLYPLDAVGRSTRRHTRHPLAPFPAPGICAGRSGPAGPGTAACRPGGTLIPRCLDACDPDLPAFPVVAACAACAVRPPRAAPPDVAVGNAAAVRRPAGAGRPRARPGARADRSGEAARTGARGTQDDPAQAWQGTHDGRPEHDQGEGRAGEVTHRPGTLRAAAAAGRCQDAIGPARHAPGGRERDPRGDAIARAAGARSRRHRRAGQGRERPRRPGREHLAPRHRRPGRPSWPRWWRGWSCAWAPGA